MLLLNAHLPLKGPIGSEFSKILQNMVLYTCPKLPNTPGWAALCCWLSKTLHVFMALKTCVAVIVPDRATILHTRIHRAALKLQSVRI